jgi:V/A-type H+-transporting ATPase subunit I
VERWLEQAAPALERLEALNAELETLNRWRGVLEGLAGTGVDLGALARCGPALAGYCLVWPAGVEPADPLDGVLRRELELNDGGQASLGIMAADRLPDLTELARAKGGHLLPVPDWLDDGPETGLQALDRKIPERIHEIQQIEYELRELAERRGVRRARGTLERIAWFRDAASNIECEGDLCWITGWTSETEQEEMTSALRSVGVKADVELVEPPEDVSMPSLTEHPAWLRPFEVFTRAVGVPGTAEADPTTWLALLVPLMFGYMCGDVGHGLVIAAIGLALIGRTRHWPLLLWCGLSATGFGFVFGDFFGYEHIFDPLWLRPLDEPLTVLLVPLAGGAVVLTLGVVLHTVQTCWRGEGASQGVADLGQLLVYWGCLAAFLDLRLGWLAVGGVLVCFANRLARTRAPLALLAGLGSLLESTFSLLLNTLSFARIGAFALAHAALESAIISTADAMSTAALAVLVAIIGNLVVIALESLVVSIQTSRLVLYEFLTRFFEGKGRAFEPAARPPGPDRPADTGR